MNDQEAKEIIQQKISKGGVLAVAGHADLRQIKALQLRCLVAGIPVVLGPVNSKG